MIFSYRTKKDMKKIINGRLYDTDTAKKLGSYDNEHFTTDFNYHREELFQKRTGEYFIVNTSYDYTIISPATEKKAKEWCEEHLTGEEYISIFGNVEE